jgi:hypothetical protein
MLIGLILTLTLITIIPVIVVGHSTNTMTTAVYSGSLQPKKKAELKEIASALHIRDAGTKEELQQRIRKHLDDNQVSLEDNPTFAGLFRRKKAVQQFTHVCVSPCSLPSLNSSSPQKFRCIPCFGIGGGDIREEAY